MKLFAYAALSALALTLALPAAAQSAAQSGAQTGVTFAKPEDAVKYRQSALALMNAHMGRLGQMATGRAPYDAKAAVENAEILATLSRLPWAGFGPGTDKISPKAKPEIWSEPAKFKDHADKMQAEVAKLVTAARTNNLDDLKAAFGPAAASCKACHDNFRN